MYIVCDTKTCLCWSCHSHICCSTLKLFILAGATQPKSMLHSQQWHLDYWHVMACQLTAVLAPLKAWHGLTAGAHHKRTRSICLATRSIGIQDAELCFVIVPSVVDLHSTKQLMFSYNCTRLSNAVLGMSGMVGWLEISCSTVNVVVTNVMLKISSKSWKLKNCSYTLRDCHTCAAWCNKLSRLVNTAEADWTSLPADTLCGSKHNVSKKQPWTQRHQPAGRGTDINKHVCSSRACNHI